MEIFYISCALLLNYYILTGDEQLSSDIEVLRDFDLQLDYGPCIGKTLNSLLRNVWGGKVTARTLHF